jgi:hypothetical protein
MGKRSRSKSNEDATEDESQSEAATDELETANSIESTEARLAVEE